ncbi:MAG: NAD(P)H-hydrate dehydratase [Azospirillaceae bacterium]|nr:NAD(P)H-hydrate dehydratase [Azospirillaceae bacterium]
MSTRLELLTVAEMAEADRLTIVGGIRGALLMEAAGAAVALEIQRRWLPRPVVVLCGPGNNGGDGFVVARLLAESGWPIRLGLLGERGSLKGDAAIAAATWPHPVETLSPDLIMPDGLLVDALFGAGLSRPLEGVALDCVRAMNERHAIVVAVDVPSGVHGDSGAVLDAAPRATLTVTFFRRKPGHWLLPGRLHCGETVLADIGIDDRVLDQIVPSVAQNAPGLWGDRFPWPRPENHKYHRGHALVLGGAQMTGAARLAAAAAQRVGAGLVSIAAPTEVVPLYALSSPSLLVAPLSGADAWPQTLDGRRFDGVLVGPGLGPGPATAAAVAAVLERRLTAVIDADGLSAFAGAPSDLFERLHDRCLLTPHDGEFRRLFGPLHPDDKIARARAAARQAGATVLLKGYDTVIATPEGRVAINVNAPPDLATAGAGDVLAGLALGLMVQGLDPFDAACTAAWLHGEAARSLGAGMIADDLPCRIPWALRRLRRGLAPADVARC